MKRLCKLTGYTLVEILVAMLIVAILAAVSITTYSSYIRKGRRADGINALLALSLAEENYRATSTQYGSLAQVWGGVATSSQGYYTLSITNISASGYTLRAVAAGNQAADTANGTACATLQLVFSNGTITKSPAACWPS